jgi:pimeloyl-ACP methyl ester carboxylesterase
MYKRIFLAGLGVAVLCASLAAQPGATRKTARVNGLNISYLQWGADGAPPMLLIPGAGTTAISWSSVAPAFAKDFRVISIDRPGLGFSDWDPEKHYSVATNVACYKELARILGLKNIVVVGHSQGGNEAVVFAAENADNVVALVAEDGGYMSPDVMTNPERRAEDAQRGIPATPPPPGTEPITWEQALAEAPWWAPGQMTPEERQAATEARFKPTGDGRFILRDDPNWMPVSEADSMMQRGATAPYARRVKCPTMVMRGGNDTAFTMAAADMLTSLIPNVRMEAVVPGAGHGLQRDRRAEFIALVRAFLSVIPAQK